MKILKFSATWCHPCQQLAKILEGMKPYLAENNIELEEYDVEDNDELAEKYGIRSVPTLIFLKDNMVLATIVGLTSADNIKRMIDNIR